MTKMRDPEGHSAMQAAGEAWKKIKTRGARTWTEWTEVIGPGLVMARTEARSISNKPVGKGYNNAMGALLEEYGFGNAVERFRSKVERADLLHCMDYLTEIEEWREKAKRSVLEAVERKQHQHYPSHIALNHPTVVWRHFKASKDGKEAFKDRGIEPKLRAPKKTDDDLRQELAAKQAYIEELEAARSSATEPAAEPTAVPAAVAIAEAVTSDIQLARSNYVALLPRRTARGAGRHHRRGDEGLVRPGQDRGVLGDHPSYQGCHVGISHVNKLYAERQPPRIVQLFTPTTGDDHEPADPMPTKPGSKRKTKKTDTSATSLEDHIAKRHADAKAKQESRFDTMPSRPIAQACRNTSYAPAIGSASPTCTRARSRARRSFRLLSGSGR